jgi:hypothetical protein
MPVVSMSKKEFDRLEVLLGVRSGRLRVADACGLLDLKRRQVFRLLANLKHGGAASLISKRRGRPSNNRLPEAYRDLALSLVRERYVDFGPTLPPSKAARCHFNFARAMTFLPCGDSRSWLPLSVSQRRQLGVTIDPAAILRPPCAACHSAAASSGVISPIPKQRMLRPTF